MRPAYVGLMEGNPAKLAKLLKDFLYTRSIRSLKDANESVLLGIIEFLLDQPRNRIPELILAKYAIKEKGVIIQKYADIFLTPDPEIAPEIAPSQYDTSDSKFASGPKPYT